METKIRFQGSEYLFVGDLIEGGAIATQEQYENGECSSAHLFPDGRILRFRKQIGVREDIEVIEQVDVSIKPDAFYNIFVSPTWPSNRE